MKPAYLAAAAIALILTIKACGPYMSDSDIKQNPNPKLRYELTLTIDGAPGPFDSVEGSALYQVSNDQCVPVTGKPINPMRIAPHTDVPIRFARIDQNTFRGTLYLDQLQSDDYFGLGVCHWSLISVSLSPIKGKTTFHSGIFLSDIVAETPDTRFFVGQDYLDAIAGRAPDTVVGNPSASFFRPEFQHEIFSIKTQAKEGFE